MSVTQVRVALTRLPPPLRQRLQRLAVRGGEGFRRYASDLRKRDEYLAGCVDVCSDVCMGLELALGDLAGAELRAQNAEIRARRAEAELALARKTIVALQSDLADHVHAEFAEPTQVRPDETNPLIARCRTVG